MILGSIQTGPGVHIHCFMKSHSALMVDGANSVQVTIGEGSHPENVKVYGPGVEKAGLKANEPTYFTVDCSEAGQGKNNLNCK